MPCHKLMDAWVAKEVNPSGKRSYVFSPKYSLNPDDPRQVACRKCMGCRVGKSKDWAVRCMHENQMHEKSSFITLTFNDESLFKRKKPWDLDHKEFQKFMKRLRRHLDYKGIETPLKYFMCGEYGDLNARPHYHAILFGIDFDDKTLWKIVDGQRLYISETLESLWPSGFSTIGNVTFQSAAYVARYMMKKQYGDIAEEHYTYLDTDTGEIISKKPEYQAQSTKPAIGKDWFDQFKDEIYPKDYVTLDGKRYGVPKYYDILLKREDEDYYDEILNNRLLQSKIREDDNTYDRLLVKEQVLRNKIDKFIRDVNKR